MPEPGCSSCYDNAFDGRLAARELRRLREHGPGRASVAIADALASGRTGAAGLSVLDIGGGVGAVHELLLERGAASAVDIDASRPYLEAARSEAARRGVAERVTFINGDFTAVAPEVEPADLVALDRVVCCFGDMDALVGRAAARTRRRLALTIPPDWRLVRAMIGLGNAWYRLTRNPYRAYVHRHERVVAAARREGLELVARRSVGAWRLFVFERPILTADGP